MADWIVLFLLILSVILAILTIEAKSMLLALSLLFGMTVSIGLIFGLLEAAYVMYFHLMIYGGASLVLLATIMMFTGRDIYEEKSDLLINLAGTLCITFFGIAFLILLQHEFVPFKYSILSIENMLIASNAEIGAEISSGIWNIRQLDMVFLAVLLFSTAICSTILTLRNGSEDN
jgi:NADH:ubiquinone oxidoreductase subunit 6 (subunit J)